MGTLSHRLRAVSINLFTILVKPRYFNDFNQAQQEVFIFPAHFVVLLVLFSLYLLKPAAIY